MKKIIFLLTVSLFTLQSFSQTQTPEPTKDYYLQKSKNQKKTGWIILAGGTTIGVIGGISLSQMDFWSSDDSAYDAAGMLLFGGIVTDLVSIPFFISSAGNARRLQPSLLLTKR